MWLGVWNSSANSIAASFLSTSFLRFTTSCQSSTSWWHVKILSTLETPIFKLLWSNENPTEHELWHIYFLSLPMRCNIGYFFIKFVAFNICQSKTSFDWLKCLSTSLLHEHTFNFFEYLFKLMLPKGVIVSSFHILVLVLFSLFATIGWN